MLIGLSAVVVTILRGGISSAFFRFYFDSKERAARLLVLRTSFWYTMTAATAGLVVGLSCSPAPIGDLVGVARRRRSSRAAFVGVWAQMNYEQLTSLFRVEERSVAFVCATLANLLVTVGATVVLVVGLDQGPLGVIVGNWIGTLVVYLGLLGYRREQLGLQFDRPLLRRDAALRLAARAVGARADLSSTSPSRFFLSHFAGLHEVGQYELGAAHRLGDGAAADGVPARLAGVRVLDRGRRARRSGRTPSCSRTWC